MFTLIASVMILIFSAMPSINVIISSFTVFLIYSLLTVIGCLRTDMSLLSSFSVSLLLTMLLGTVLGGLLVSAVLNLAV